MVLLNLGCGSRVHPDWVNIDYFPTAMFRRFFSRSSLPVNFVNHDLRKGIPIGDSSADAVYSSHLLEHLPPESVPLFLREHRRVLKTGGVARIVVPDLELAARQYLKALENCRVVGEAGQLEHEWATILLLDQLVRIRSGGQMQAWLMKHRETKLVRSMQGIFIEIAQASIPKPAGFSLASIKSWLRRNNQLVSAGELHRWMYDELALKRLLKTCGFDLVKIVDPDTSRIQGWSNYYLDRSPGGTIHQPGSIYIEGIKD